MAGYDATHTAALDDVAGCIEVRVAAHGSPVWDTAYAPDPEAAVATARTMCDEADNGCWGNDPVITFLAPDGTHVRTLTRRALARQLLVGAA